MAVGKIKCRECRLCDIKQEKCELTNRTINLDSERNCKRGVKKSLVEKET